MVVFLKEFKTKNWTKPNLGAKEGNSPFSQSGNSPSYFHKNKSQEKSKAIVQETLAASLFQKLFEINIEVHVIDS